MNEMYTSGDHGGEASGHDSPIILLGEKVTLLFNNLWTNIWVNFLTTFKDSIVKKTDISGELFQFLLRYFRKALQRTQNILQTPLFGW